MLKAIIKEVTPPIFLTVARKLLPAPSVMHNCGGRFASYQEAYKVSSSAGYEDDLIIRAVHAKTLARCFEQYAVSVRGQADILICGVPFISPYNINSILNPILVCASSMRQL